MSTLITEVLVKDIRFPTSRQLDGSDAMNPDPDYSAAYVILSTNHEDGLEGHGLTFTIGRGNEICVKAIESMKYLLEGKAVESFIEDMAGFYRMMTGDSQLRWLGGVNEVLAVLLMAARFDVPVCPHAGGVGLCEHVQHLSILDYIAISGKLEGRVLEYVDHLHEHFIDPVVIRNGHYMPPQLPGYSIEMKPGSIRDYSFPEGKAWTHTLQTENKA